VRWRAPLAGAQAATKKIEALVRQLNAVFVTLLLARSGPTGWLPNRVGLECIVGFSGSRSVV
jgi:hypothetical protein